MSKLHPFQLDWLGRIKSSPHRRILLVGATGIGKTVVAAELVQEALAQGSRVLMMARSRELVTQASVRLIDAGVPEGQIGLVCGGCKPCPSKPIQVATVSALSRRGAPKADVIVIDEAHHTAASTWAALERSYGEAKIYGLTATAERLDGKGLGPHFDDLVAAPGVTELAAAGYLRIPKVYVPRRINLTGLRKRGGDFEVRGATKQMRRLTGDIVSHWLKLAKDLPTVVYAVSLAHAKHLRRRFAKVAFVAVVTGNTPLVERQATLAKFAAGELHVLINVNVLTEGWDCPTARCAVIARPTLSSALMTQMCGRVMRAGPIEPIVIDCAGNLHRTGMLHPGEDRVYTLDSGRERKSAVEPRWGVCSACSLAVVLNACKCPHCGETLRERKDPIEKLGELEEFPPPKRRKLTVRRRSLIESAFLSWLDERVEPCEPKEGSQVTTLWQNFRLIHPETICSVNLFGRLLITAGYRRAVIWTAEGPRHVVPLKLRKIPHDQPH